MNELILLIVVLSAWIRYFLGFGSALLFVPLSSTIIGFNTAVALSVLLELIISLVIAIRSSTFTIVNIILIRMVISSVLGLAAGSFILTYISEEFIYVLSMLLILVFGFLILYRKDQISDRTELQYLSGFFSGFLNICAGMSGPPVVFYVYFTSTNIVDARKILNSYFFVLYLLTAIVFFMNGRYDNFKNWEIVFLSVPLFFASIWLASAMPLAKNIATYRYISISIIQISVLYSLVRYFTAITN